MVRQVERRYGLPDLELSEAGEELRDHILIFSGVYSRPMLRRALQGPAGPLICHSALKVVLEGDYMGINPELGEALKEAFANQSGGQLRRSARQPFLRLGEDYCSLEIVGPRQEESVVDPGRLWWVVDGASYPTAPFEEFVFPVQGSQQISIELRGLRSGVTASRTFGPRLEGRLQPFMIFDIGSRKLRREESGRTTWLPCGDYYLLHSQDARTVPEVDRWDWPDGERALSLLQIRPEHEIKLEDVNSWSFRAAAVPFIEPRGHSLATDDGELIHYGWKDLPEICRPHDDDARRDYGWEARVEVPPHACTYSLSNGEVVGTTLRCRLAGRDFLEGLPAGLHEIQIAVFQRQRCHLKRSYWLWVGLEAYIPGDQFVLSALPVNLTESGCRGFDISPQSIRHRSDAFRQHHLVFNIYGVAKRLAWSRKGFFLESSKRTAGQAVQPVTHKLGETFSASPDSQTWLRVWCIPAIPAELCLNEQVLQRMKSGQNHRFFDVSLAQISSLHPQGGQINLKWENAQTLIALFARPLVTDLVQIQLFHSSKSVKFFFRELVEWAKPRVIDLVTGRTVELLGRKLVADDEEVFSGDEMSGPSCFLTVLPDGQQYRSAIELLVPKAGWPQGLWLVELQVSRGDCVDWQVVTDKEQHRAPVIVSGGDDDFSPDSPIFIDPELKGATESSAEEENAGQRQHKLIQLMSNVFHIVQNEFVTGLETEFDLLQHLLGKAAQIVSRAIHKSPRDDINKLLQLATDVDILPRSGAGSFGKQSIFVAVPELMALSAEQYLQAPINHPLGTSLSWCGRLRNNDFAFEAFREMLEDAFFNPHSSIPETVAVLRNFRNFPLVIQQNGEGVQPLDFSRFDYRCYFGQTVGCIHELDSQLEWDASNVLGVTHAQWAVSQFITRLENASLNRLLGSVNAFFSDARTFAKWLSQTVTDYHGIVPPDAANSMSLSVSFEEPDILSCCNEFASAFALAARAAAAGRLSFEAVLQQLARIGGDRPIVTSAIATLVDLAPELFGFYLMFWELMIRTYPHD
jgi:hypothetical protein